MIGPPAERIATFANDGTLWSERPYPFQVAFVLDQVKKLAPQHPEWHDEEPFKSLLAGDMKGTLSGGYHALIAIGTATHSGHEDRVQPVTCFRAKRITKTPF
jgi:hypothetical protein